MIDTERPSPRRVLAELRPHKRRLLTGGAATVALTAVTAVGPLLVAHAIDHGVVPRRLQPVLFAAGVYAVLVVIQIAATSVEARAYGRFAQDFLRDLRVRMLDHFYRLDLDFFTRERSGRLVARLTSDVENLQQFAETGVGLIVRTTLVISVVTVVMLSRSLPLTLVVALVLIPFVIATVWYRSKAFPAQLAVRETMAGLYAHVNESLVGMRVVQAYGLEAEHTEQFMAANGEGVSAKHRTANLNAAYSPVVEFVQPAATAAVIAAGALLVLAGDLSVGAVVAFTLYLTRLFEPITQLTELTHQLQAASATYAKVLAFQDERPLVADRPGAKPIEKGPGRVTFEAVDFRYDRDRPHAVRGIDLDLVPGQRVALVGGSGAGKSTLAKLAARFYDPTAGRVLVDGQDVRDVTGASLRRAVALVPQEGFLFDGSVAENISVSRPGATRDDVEAACRALGVLRRLKALPDGLDTPVTNRGLSLSAGQRQLVALARAMLADPGVVILDEATSNLDPATEAVVERGLRRLFAGRTAVVIAHRPQTAWRADRVVVLEHGRIAEDGPAATLSNRGGAFDRWISPTCADQSAAG